jgi:hypothetical protein
MLTYTMNADWAVAGDASHRRFFSSAAADKPAPFSAALVSHSRRVNIPVALATTGPATRF